jgi:5-formyltetrahydrofolate cyclo-ligase
MCSGRNDDLGKAEWRARLAAARDEVTQAQRVLEARALLNALAAMNLPDTVCCYVPFGTEPGSVAWLDLLRDAGKRVLLPVIPTGPAPLDWAEHTGPLAPGRLRGVLEPTGPRLGPAALGEAGLVLVPALAVDHGGTRLGRGAGYYDRSLPHAAPDAVLLAPIRDDELIDHLPTESHDIRMTAVLTPRRGFVKLPLS